MIYSISKNGQASRNAILFRFQDRVVRKCLLERLKSFCGRLRKGDTKRILSNK